MDYQEQIGPQRKTVDALESEYAAKPSDELKSKLVRETDLLRYLENAAKGDPRDRAREAGPVGAVQPGRADHEVGVRERGPHLLLTGGEPLLRKNLERLIEMLARLGDIANRKSEVKQGAAVHEWSDAVRWRIGGTGWANAAAHLLLIANKNILLVTVTQVQINIGIAPTKSSKNTVRSKRYKRAKIETFGC